MHGESVFRQPRTSRTAATTTTRSLIENAGAGFANSQPASVQFDDVTVLKRYPPVHPICERHVVRRDQHCHPRRFHKLHQRIEHVIRGVGIQVAGRFIRKQHPRRVGNGPRDRNPLLFAAGQFCGTMGDAILEAEIGENFARA